MQTFFSTDIVRYQNTGNGASGAGSFSTHALLAWLQVTLPLTALTVSGAWITYKVSERSRRQKKEETVHTSKQTAERLTEKKTWFGPELLRRRSTAKLPLFSEKNNPV